MLRMLVISIQNTVSMHQRWTLQVTPRS